MTTEKPSARGTPEHPFDVAIIGLGPTGATLAHLLASRGLSVLVLDREADVYSLPRAVHFDGECMRIFQTIGVAQDLLPDLYSGPGTKFVNGQGQVLLQWTHSDDVGPQGWRNHYRCHQPQLEQVLRKRLAGHPEVAVRLRHDVFAVENTEGGVLLRFEDLSRGALGSASARYVVGCDGARSTVRRFMNTELDDLKVHQRWVVVDALLKRNRDDLGDHSIQYCNPKRPATYIRGVGNRRRWEIMLMPGDDSATITQPEQLWGVLSPWIAPADADLERAAVYTFHSVVAKGWRRGRLLIAGDAAHQTPPFLGQGMCAGLRDAANLAWKLADVVSGQAETELLDTYESERSPHVRQYIETAVSLGSLIQTTDPEVARRRDAEMAANPQTFEALKPALGPGLHDGGSWGGHVSSQPRLQNGILMDDAVGYDYALICTSEVAQGLRELPERVRMLVADASADLKAYLEAMQSSAVLVRPDRYVFGTARTVDAARTLMARARIAPALQAA
jgi:3-(3-hydroxy-phenyl)propionate hydroxylase